MLKVFVEFSWLALSCTRTKCVFVLACSQKPAAVLTAVLHCTALWKNKKLQNNDFILFSFHGLFSVFGLANFH